tara:strand:- start:829 stop:1704 length:876 start_codon:yes stop_codon:yes gene_type:complete
MADGMDYFVINEGGVTAHRHAGLYQNFTIDFISAVSSLNASFPAILTAFNDAWTSNWNSQDVYGRQDQVHTFKNTTRRIDLTFSVVPDDETQSADLMHMFEKLVRMLYPNYDDAPDESPHAYQGANVSLVRQAPIMGIRMGNLIRGNAKGGYLLGKVDGFTFNPDIQQGFWLANSMTNNPDMFDEWAMLEPEAPNQPIVNVSGAVYLPKKWEVSVSFTVMHTEPLNQGSDPEGWNGDSSYPYNGEQISKAFSPEQRMPVIIEESPALNSAKIPKKVKKGFLDQVLDSLIGF